MKLNGLPKLIKFKIVKIVFNALALFFLYIFIVSFDNKEAIDPPSQNAYKIKTVVIDAGHGGADPGAKCNGTLEKNVNLAIALNLGKRISTSYPDIKVVYTRTKDVFIGLDERANIANQNKADLFISIHCNSAKTSIPYGTETYVLGLHSTPENLEVAKRENSVILLEENYEKKYDGFDPNSPEAYIIFSLHQNKNIDKSLHFASKLEYEFGNKNKRNSRGVKQAGFLVLRRTNMPAILIESGFLSNVNEGKFLASPAGQQEIANSIFNAFTVYKKELEK